MGTRSRECHAPRAGSRPASCCCRMTRHGWRTSSRSSWASQFPARRSGRRALAAAELVAGQPLSRRCPHRWADRHLPRRAGDGGGLAALIAMPARQPRADERHDSRRLAIQQSHRNPGRAWRLGVVDRRVVQRVSRGASSLERHPRSHPPGYTAGVDADRRPVCPTRFRQWR